MNKGILKSLLQRFHDHITLTEDQLGVIHEFLFEDVNLVPSDFDEDFTKTLEIIKQIVVHYGLSTVVDLQEYYRKRKEKQKLFINNVIEKTSKSSITKDIVALSNYSIPANGSIIINFNDPYDKREPLIFNTSFKQYLDNLSVDYLQSLGRCIRIEFARMKSQIVDLAVEYEGQKFLVESKSVLRKKSFARYFENFSNHQRLVLWGAPEPTEELPFEARPFSHLMQSPIKCRYNKETNQESDEDRLSELYDSILGLIRKEQPISDKKVKHKLISWLIFSQSCYTKVVTRDDLKRVCNDPSSDWTANNSTNLTHYSIFQGNRSIESTNEMYKTALLLKQWTILKSPSGSSWLTSDNPGFGINLADQIAGDQNVHAVSQLEEIRNDTLIYYPLSNDYCLRIEPNLASRDNRGIDIIHFEESSHKEWRLINGLTISTKNQMVVGKDKTFIMQLQDTEDY